MQKLLREERGFTLIELVMVIVVLGILAVVAIPKYADLRYEAKEAAEKGVAGAVRGGIYAAHAESLMNDATNLWPTSLEGAAGAAVFEAVLTAGIDTLSTGWSVSGNTYTGPTDSTYTYDPNNGTFD